MADPHAPPSLLFGPAAATSYAPALPILRALNDAGHEAYLVGGGLRDLLLGRAAADWDVATSATPEEMFALWPDALPTGIRHGTLTVGRGPEGIEVTSYRTEGPYSDGRHPDWVRFGTELSEDLARRDFTINAFAFNPLHGAWADEHQGLVDLERRVLRAVGDPGERFREDALRLLRGARLAAVLEFTLAPETETAMAESASGLTRVSAERIRDELIKLLAAREPSRGFRILERTGLLGVVLPELAEGVGVEQNRWHAHTVFEHTLHVLDAVPADQLTVRLAALLHDVGKPRTRKVVDGEGTFYNHEVVGASMARALMERLRFPREQRERVGGLVREHMFHYTPEWTDAAVRRFLRRVGTEQVGALFQLRRADEIGAGLGKDSRERLSELQARIGEVLLREDALSVGDLAVDGQQLMEHCGLSPGPEVGRLLHALLEQVIEDPSRNGREPLLKLARELRAKS